MSRAGEEAAAAAPRGARVEVLDRSAATAAGVEGLLLRVRPQTTGPGPVRLSVDYSGFAHAYGGDWASRLRLVRLPECAATTPGRAECRSATPVESANDSATQTVDAEVTLAAEMATATARSAQPDAATVAPAGALFALSAGTSGSAGDWSATPLSSSSTWQVSAQTGAFSWSYPLRVPPSLGGPEPQLSLSYSSGSVDGRVASTNNQTSWIGDGWELQPGYVERKYVPCAEDGTAGANNVGRETGDLCWKSDNATISLNGQASELVKDGSSGEWRFKEDDGSKIERLTGAWNSDNNTEYWKVTTTDGTQYFFGRDKRSASDPQGLNSTWTVPVFGNHPGEPCYQASYAAAYCQQAWRWNLDYVVDPRGNTMTYIYGRESNTYGRDLNQAVASYNRGGYLSAIEYGERSGSEASTTAPMRIEFDVAERCLTDCGSLTEATKANWPDVPFDLICDSSTSCPNVLSPAFFTRKRLTSITSKVLNGTAYDTVDTWTVGHRFPDPGDGQSNPVLWLDSIEHKGLRSTAITLPKVTFNGVQLANRVDAAGDLGPAMIRYRISGIDNGTGGRITVNYDPADCTPQSLPSTPHSNTRRCMPVYWTPEGHSDPVLEYFHKYRVDTVVADADPINTGDPEVVTDYVYGDAPAWHYDDSELVETKYRTWSEFRGYGTVDVLVGSPGNQSKTRYRYFRGMDGDHMPSGSRQVKVDGIDDHDRYRGFLREQITYDGATGPEVTATVSTPWLSPARATGADGTKAFLLGTGTVETRTTAPALPGGVRRTRTVTSFDSTYGLATQVDDQGDTVTADDDLCTRYEYARNSGLHIVDAVARTETVAVSCAGTPARPDDVVTDIRQFYDGSTTVGAAPSKGLVTKTEEVKSYTGATPAYVTTSTTGYDTYGRVRSIADALGRTTTTAYTPATGGPLTRTVVTSPDPDGSGALTAHVTTTDLDPAFGTPTKVTDPNGKVTEASYDALGRLLKVWLPGRTTGQTPNLEHSYHLRTDGPSAVTTKKLIHNGSQLTSIQLFDGLLRARQTQATAAGDNGGRVITDTRYDARGLVVANNHAYHDLGAPSTNLFVPSTTVPGRTEILYDGAGRATNEIFLKQGVEQWRTVTSYGGDRVTVDPPTGGTATTTISDARGRTTQLRQYLGDAPTGSHQDTIYGYDHAHRLAAVTDPAGNQWSYDYNLRGQQTSATDPDRGHTTSTYDDAGQLTSTTDVGRNLTLAYGYDSLGRKTELRDTSTSGALRASWDYDTLAKGQLTSSTRYDGSAEYTTAVTSYDNAYRPLGQSVTLPSTGAPSGEAVIAGTYTTNYTYTVDGKLRTLRFPSTGNLGAETITTHYDAVSLPEWMGSGLGWGGYVAGSAWSAFGQPLLLDLGSTYFQHVTYDYETGTNRLTNQKLLRQNTAGNDLNATYGYDETGNITSIINRPVGVAIDAQCFTYDGLRRLTNAWTPANANCSTTPTVEGMGGPAPYWTSFTYDAVGNRDVETRHAAAGNTVRDYSYPTPGSDRPHAVTEISETGPGGDKTYQYAYDTAGNTTCRPAATTSNICPTGTGSHTLTWNAEGRVQEASAGGADSSYVYTAGGERLIRRENGVTTVYLPGGQELRLTVSNGSKATTRYYTFAGQTVAVRTGAGLAGVSTLVSDYHNTASLSIANTTNTLTRRYSEPFGNPRGTNSIWPGDHGFLDKPTDAIGLTNIGAREYDAVLGRFISVDPIMDLTDPQQWNGYAYANNNPTTYSDPSGLAHLEGGGKSDGRIAHQSGGTIKISGRKLPKSKPSKKSNDEVLAGNDTYRLTRTPSGALQLNGVPVPPGLDEETVVREIVSYCDALPEFCEANLSCPYIYIEDCTGIWEEGALAVMRGALGGEFGLSYDRALYGTLPQAIQEGFAEFGWGGGGRLVSRFMGKSHRGSCLFKSFAGDTEVLLADGSTKPIEDIEVGDTVWATNPQTGEEGPRKVIHVWIHNDQLVDLKVDSGTLITTEDHPFWNETDQQWQDSQDLDRGDLLRTATGESVAVDGLDWATAQRGTAYNLTVADIHTYYVLAGNTPVLVHNTGPCDVPALGPHRPAGVGDDWTARTADNGKGTVWQAPGATGNASMVRTMNPTAQYPNGYVRFHNRHGQPIGLNGKPGSKAETHIPMNPDGTFPTPVGW